MSDSDIRNKLTEYPVILHDLDDEVEVPLGDLIEIDALMSLFTEEMDKRINYVIGDDLPTGETVPHGGGFVWMEYDPDTRSGILQINAEKSRLVNVRPL